MFSAPRLRLSLAAAALAAVTAATPVLACTPSSAPIPPGLWTGYVANLSTQFEDDMATAVTDGSGWFWLEVSDEGSIDRGQFEFNAIGYAQSMLDESASAARFTVEADVSGVATKVDLEGTMTIEMEAIIDVYDGEGEDPYSGTGQDLYGFDSTFDSTYRAEMTPTSAGCSTVSGTMPAPVGFDTNNPSITFDGGDTDDGGLHFYGFRQGAAPDRGPDLEAQLVELMDDAESFVDMEPFDSDAFLGWMGRLLSFDSLVATLEACNPDDRVTVGPAWDMIRSVMLGSIHRLLRAAETGAYETSNVMGAMTAFLRGGLLGWRGEECISPDADEYAHELFVRFEDLLINRLQLAWDAGDQLEIRLIATAGWMFGLPRLMAALEGME